MGGHGSTDIQVGEEVTALHQETVVGVGAYECEGDSSCRAKQLRLDGVMHWNAHTHAV